MVILEGEAAFLEGGWAELLVSLSHQYLSPKPKSPKYRTSRWNLIQEQDMVSFEWSFSNGTGSCCLTFLQYYQFNLN